MKKLVDLAAVCSLDRLIRSGEATGSHIEIAKKLNISRTTLFETISYLQVEMRVPIYYNVRGKMLEYEFCPKFYLSQEIINILICESETDIANKCGNRSDCDFDSEENDTDDERSNEILELSELSVIEGGVKEEVWYKDSIDNDSDNVILDDDIDFNNLFFDGY